MADDGWLGGYTMKDLLGAAPVSKSPKQIKQEEKAARKAAGKRGPVAAVIGAPFRLVLAVIKVPVKLIGEILRLPRRLLALVTRPFRG